ncbi:hypothetical protein FRC03_001076 [Tulasnella sp. 419]|nr:hypothetical protein FRC03_001076 [Tulasnella sp. 419]
MIKPRHEGGHVAPQRSTDRGNTKKFFKKAYTPNSGSSPKPYAHKFKPKMANNSEWAGKRHDFRQNDKRGDRFRAKEGKSFSKFEGKGGRTWEPLPPQAPVQEVIVTTSYLRPLLQETAQLPFSRSTHLSPADQANLRVLQETKPDTIPSRAGLLLARNPTVTVRQRLDFIAKVQELSNA